MKVVSSGTLFHCESRLTGKIDVKSGDTLSPLDALGVADASTSV